MTQSSNDNDGGGNAPRKRRVRKYDPFKDCATNLLFEPMFRVGEGKQARKVSAAEIMLLRQYRDACEGKPSGMRAMIKVMRENQKVREREQKEREANAPIHFTLIGGPGEDPCNADAALLILGVATIDRRRLGYLRQTDSSRPIRWLLVLEPDVLAAARQRPEAAKLDDRQEDAVARCTRPEQEPPVTQAELDGRSPYDHTLLPRDPKATRFRPGQSGNPKGRPPKDKLELPFDGFLNEVIPVPVEGSIREMTRLDALFYEMIKRGLGRDNRIEQTLFDLVVKEQARKFEPKPRCSPITETRI